MTPPTHVSKFRSEVFSLAESLDPQLRLELILGAAIATALKLPEGSPEVLGGEVVNVLFPGNIAASRAVVVTFDGYTIAFLEAGLTAEFPSRWRVSDAVEV